MSISRREFVGMTGLAAATALSGDMEGAGIGPVKTYRAAVIGRTGRGNYGHGLDLAFQKIPNVTVVAVADEDPAGRLRTVQRTGALRAYADWREMLSKEKPDLVTIGPRWVEDRLEMVTAAAQAGSHIYMEKPMARSLEEADAILTVASRHGIQIALAHQARVAPAIVYLKEKLEGGLIGELLEMRTRGKEDHRAGGEDLMVLGTHCLYLMRFFAGEPLWCCARVTQSGKDIKVGDRRAATEPLGPVAGDAIHASYAFAGGIQGYFASQKVHDGAGGRFEIALYGSKGIVRVHIDQNPAIYVLADPLWSPGKSGTAWRSLPGCPGNEDPSGLTGAEASNKRTVEDLIRAIETGKPSVVSGYEGRATLEMIMAVYGSHLQGGRAAFPLKDRRHPLGEL